MNVAIPISFISRITCIESAMDEMDNVSEMQKLSVVCNLEVCTNVVKAFSCTWQSLQLLTVQKLLPIQSSSVYLHRHDVSYVMKSPWIFLQFLHTVSNQKLDSGKA